METTNSGLPPFRPLRIYAFDPTLGRTLGNYMEVDVPYEKLKPGPRGGYLDVIDYDVTNKCYYNPVDLDAQRVLLRNGLDPSESDPQFHQQMVYAVASETIKRFEYALGRSIRWSFDKTGVRDDSGRAKLRIFPHAMREANAYYDRDLRALVFGYFSASETDAGLNLPGQTVFTCLSHDVIAHETTHALVDSQRDYFTEPTGPDAPAFHEAFADIVALFQHFSYEDALVDVIQQTGGRMYQPEIKPKIKPGKGGPLIQAELPSENPLVGLAKQFGDAMGMRKALRSALGTPPNSKALESVFEPHTRGSILVAAVFDAFFSIYVRRTSDLMRIARAGGIKGDSEDLHPDLAKRLAKEGAKTAEHFLNICIRALDYCPPVDITFGDFLRAMITADYDIVPDDKYGYRAALIDAFRSRGIVPEDVSSYSEESLLWRPPDVADPQELPRCSGLYFDVFKPEDTESQREQQTKNGVTLHTFADKNRKVLGLSRDPSVKVQARRFHEAHRIAPDGKLIFDVVAELMQHREVPLDPNVQNSSTFKFYGGVTMILSRDGEIRYLIHKRLGEEKDDDKNERLKRQRAYLHNRAARFGFTPYTDTTIVYEGALNFSMIHRGF